MSVWDYLLVDSSLLLINHEQLNAKEERHLLDVKRLMERLFTITLLALGVFSFSMYCVKNQWYIVLRSIASSGLAFVAVLLILVGLNGFRVSFVGFHELLFAPGTWWFASDSGLIRAFPLSYFKHFAMLYCLLLVGIFIALYVLSRIRLKAGISSSADTPS